METIFFLKLERLGECSFVSCVCGHAQVGLPVTHVSCCADCHVGGRQWLCRYCGDAGLLRRAVSDQAALPFMKPTLKSDAWVCCRTILNAKSKVKRSPDRSQVAFLWLLNPPLPNSGSSPTSSCIRGSVFPYQSQRPPWNQKDPPGVGGGPKDCPPLPPKACLLKSICLMTARVPPQAHPQTSEVGKVAWFEWSPFNFLCDLGVRWSQGGKGYQDFNMEAGPVSFILPSTVLVQHVHWNNI